ncbi:MAG: PLP-dependent aminotransferase family protein [Lachnospiraceae bacterium]|nr:PLP-dependent aminotransferase family protein [Lachnospiraceae bacterium]
MPKVYEMVYDYYINEIKSGALHSWDKMPSLRETVNILNVSRTSVETAYTNLAADGFIYPVEKVGYYVADSAERFFEDMKKDGAEEIAENRRYTYDLATIGEDRAVSCLDLWRRYMKSALRQEERLLSYADNQGEEDLREEIAVYVRKTRNIICTAKDIVIGAGYQNLLQILSKVAEDEQSAYIAPSYMTKWGEVMTMKSRREFIDGAFKAGRLIIEDDYQNDFAFSTKPMPSIYAMTGGERTAFIGSFSRVLLPSIRISYLILPRELRGKYEEVKGDYNQTSSMAEQIALAKFLRDGQLNRHIKKVRRYYEEKKALTIRLLHEAYGNKARIISGESGMEIGILPYRGLPKEKLKQCPVKVNVVSDNDDNEMLLISCSKIGIDDMREAIGILSRI